MPKLYPDLMFVTEKEQRTDLSSQVVAARDYLKDQKITHLYTSERNDTSSMFIYRPDGAFLPHLLAIDPYSNEIKGTMPLIKNIFGVSLYLHANLFLGKVGSWIVGSMGLLLVMFFISGLIIWWTESSVVQKLKLLPKSGVRGIHRGIGIFVGLPLLFSAITGFILAFDLAQPFGKLLGHPSRPEELTQSIPCNPTEELRALSILTPEQQNNLVSIHFCSPKNGLMKFSYGHHERSGHDGYVRVVVDPRTQSILQKFDTASDPSTWSANQLIIYPMHTGAYFGGWARILNILCGFALAILFITGLYPTLKKRFRSK